MKAMSEELLIQYGFESIEVKQKGIIKTFSKNNFVVVMEQDDSFYYSYIGIEYPLKNEDDLQKIYFEARREKLTVGDLAIK
jgi:hypothetical protein